MAQESKVRCIGILTSGGDCPGLNAAIRAVTKAAQLMARSVFNVMVGYDSGLCEAVPLEETAGRRKTVPPDHPMILSARLVGTCMGDQPAIGYRS